MAVWGLAIRVLIRHLGSATTRDAMNTMDEVNCKGAGRRIFYTVAPRTEDLQRLEKRVVVWKDRHLSFLSELL